MNAIPFSGLSVETHAFLLPIEPLKRLDVNWCRAGTNVQNGHTTITPSVVSDVVKWYPWPVLWALNNDEPSPACIKTLVQAGIRDIQIGVEPDWQEPRMTPKEYALWFKACRKVAGRSVRLYGPGTCVWNPEYIQECIRYGCKFDGIAAHLYWQRIEDIPKLFAECWRRFGLPLVCAELGFVLPRVEATNYPEQRDSLRGLTAMRDQLGYLPCNFYDGVQGSNLPGVGLFDADENEPVWNRRFKVPTALLTQSLATTTV